MIGAPPLALVLLLGAASVPPARASVEPTAEERRPPAVVVDKPGGRVALDARPVSGRAYSRCVDAGRCARPSYDRFNRDPEYGDEPAMSITWFMARDYCAWVGRRLPTLDEVQRAQDRLQFVGCCARGAIPREWIADEPEHPKATQVRAQLRRGQLAKLEVLVCKKRVGYDSSTVRCALDLSSPAGSDAASPSTRPAAAP